MSILTLVGALLLTMVWVLVTQEVYSPFTATSHERGPRLSSPEKEELENKIQDMNRKLDAVEKQIQDAIVQASKIEEENPIASPEAARLPPVLDEQAQALKDAMTDAMTLESLVTKKLDELRRFRARQPQGSAELDAQIAKLESQLQEIRTHTRKLASLSTRI